MQSGCNLVAAGRVRAKARDCRKVFTVKKFLILDRISWTMHSLSLCLWTSGKRTNALAFVNAHTVYNLFLAQKQQQQMTKIMRSN